MKLLRAISGAVLFVTCLVAPAMAQGYQAPLVRVVNFTADWCPNCRIFDPRLEQALEQLHDQGFEAVKVDLTITRTGSQDERLAFWQRLPANMNAAGIGPLHKGFQAFPYTGYAVVVAADTLEPLVCFMGPVSVDYLKQQLTAAKVRVENLPRGQRVPEGADCPPSFL